MNDEFDEEEGEEPSNWQMLGRYFMDWGVALVLVVVGWNLINFYRTPNLPSEAPAWRLKNLAGEEVSLSDFRGQKVVLNFWATWCGPCRMEIPSFSEFAQENPDVQVLGVSVDRMSSKKLKKKSQELGIEYPVLLGDEKIQQDYKVETLPTTVIIDEDGTVQDIHVGLMMKSQLKWAIH